MNLILVCFSTDPEDPEYVRQMQRPAEVKEDIRQMEDRQRVGLIMKTQAFREELEEMINDQIRSGPHPASLLALQQISELILPNAKAKGAAAGGKGLDAGRSRSMRWRHLTGETLTTIHGLISGFFSKINLFWVSMLGFSKLIIFGCEI